MVKSPSELARIEPLSLLLLKSRYSSWTKFPKFIGIEADRLLSPRSKLVNLIKLLSEVGIEPLKLLELNISSFSWFELPNSFGTGLESWLR